MSGLHDPSLGESDTRSKLTDPAIHARGWTEEHIRREETAGAFTKLTSPPRPMAEFPNCEELRARYEAAMGFSLAEEVAKPLVTPYAGGEAKRRYYQDAAIRAVCEKVAKAEKDSEPKRALLSLATGAGKTFIAVQLLRRIADAGKMGRALFVCDRDELQTQTLGALQNEFGNDVAAISTRGYLRRELPS